MDGVCRHITIIGEAARRLDAAFHRANPEIPWASIIGARNIVMHAYEYLKPQLVNSAVESELLVKRQESLKARVEELKAVGVAGR